MTGQTVTLRVADPAADFLALAEVLTLVEPQPVTAELLHEWESRAPCAYVGD